MTSNARKFTDGVNYSLDTALTTWNKGGNRMLTAIAWELTDAAEMRNTTKLSQIGQALVGNTAAFSTFTAICTVASKGVLRFSSETGKAKSIEKKPLNLNPDIMVILWDHTGRGHSFQNDEMLNKLGIRVAKAGEYDLAKSATSFLRKAIKEGHDLSTIKQALENAAKDLAVEENAKQPNGKPVMNGQPAVGLA